MASEAKQRSTVGAWLLAALLLGIAVIAGVAAVVMITDAFDAAVVQDGVRSTAILSDRAAARCGAGAPLPQQRPPIIDMDTDGSPDGDEDDDGGEDGDGDDADPHPAGPTTFTAAVPGAWHTRPAPGVGDVERAALASWQPLGTTPGRLTVPAGHEVRFDAALTFDDTDALRLAAMQVLPLVELRLQGCTRLTQIWLPEWAEIYSKLETLSLSDLRSLDAVEITAPRIRVLDMRRCALVDPYLNFDSAGAGGHGLQTIRLEDITGPWTLDLNGLAALRTLTVDGMPDLSGIYLYDCPALGRVDVDARALEMLEVEDCPLLQDLILTAPVELHNARIVDCPALASNWLSTAFLGALDMNTLTVSGDVPLTSQALSDCLRFTRLYRLELYSARIPDFSDVQMPWLRRLCIEGFYDPDDPDGGFIDDPDDVPAELIALNVGPAAQLRDIEIEGAPLSVLRVHDLPRLQELSVECYSVRLVDLRDLPSIWDLTLDCPACETVHLERVKEAYLWDLPSVRRLTVIGTPASEIEIGNIPKLERLMILDAPNLESVTLEEFGPCAITVTNAPLFFGIRLAYSECPVLPVLPAGLGTLVLSDWPTITTLQEVAALRGLEYLVIEDCAGLESDALTAFADHSTLRHVLYYGGTFVDDKALRALASIPNLEYLEVDLTLDVSAAALALLSGHRRLRELILNGGFSAFALDNVPLLRNLSITSDKLESFSITTAPNLEKLEVSTDADLPDAALDALAALPLTYLSIRGLFSDKAVARFTAANPDCAVYR